VEARDPIPDLTHPDLTSMSVSDDRLTATIVARSDIRESVCDQLAARGVRIRGITRKGLSLEEMFMTYYRQAG
jgi:ABC-2 type transport system ATP-binding protein